MGFQDMSEKKRKEAARKGGEQSSGGFQNMSEEERKQAAKKGGERSHGGGRPKGS